MSDPDRTAAQVVATEMALAAEVEDLARRLREFRDLEVGAPAEQACLIDLSSRLSSLFYRLEVSAETPPSSRRELTERVWAVLDAHNLVAPEPRRLYAERPGKGTASAR